MTIEKAIAENKSHINNNIIPSNTLNKQKNSITSTSTGSGSKQIITPSFDNCLGLSVISNTSAGTHSSFLNESDDNSNHSMMSP